MNAWAARLALLLAMVLLVALGVQTWRLKARDDAARAAAAALQGAQLEAAGWAKAAAASRAQLEREVPALLEQLSAARKVAADLALAAHWQGTGGEVAVPCSVTTWTPAPAAPGQPAAAAAAPAATVNVRPHVLIDEAVAIDAAGGIYVARSVQARLSVGQAWMSAWAPVLPDAPPTVKVAKDLEDAWAAWKDRPPRIGFVRPARYWRAGLTCGAGPVWAASGGLDLAAGCIYGVQF